MMRRDGLSQTRQGSTGLLSTALSVGIKAITKRQQHWYSRRPKQLGRLVPVVIRLLLGVGKGRLLWWRRRELKMRVRRGRRRRWCGYGEPLPLPEVWGVVPSGGRQLRVVAEMGLGPLHGHFDRV